MSIPTSDSLFDGTRQFHQFTDPVSSNFWDPQVLPSSPPPVVTSDVDMTDEDTDVDEEKTFVNSTTFHSNRTNTLRTVSNAAQAVAKRSFSAFESDISTFTQRVIDDPEKMIEKGILNVNFENSGLREIPDELSDLRHVVISDRQIEIKMFLAKNLISRLPASLFDLTRITVLSLRDNDLESIPPSIAQLQSLVEFHVGGNRLKCLPWELSTLPLRTLTCTPNPLVSPSTDANTRGLATKEYKISDRCPKLLELALAKCIDTCPVTMVPNHLWPYINPSNRCSMCHEAYVHEAAAIMRWIDIFGQSQVPFKSGFCSQKCYMMFEFPHSSDR